MKPISLIFFLVAASFLFSSCASLTGRIPEKSADHAEAVNLLSALNKKNQNLKAFKGIGRIKLWHNHNPGIDERVAWAGANSSNLLIVLLVSGHPAIKFSTDGNFLYYLDLTTNPRLLKKSAQPTPVLIGWFQSRFDPVMSFHFYPVAYRYMNTPQPV